MSASDMAAEGSAQYFKQHHDRSAARTNDRSSSGAVFAAKNKVGKTDRALLEPTEGDDSVPITLI